MKSEETKNYYAIVDPEIYPDKDPEELIKVNKFYSLNLDYILFSEKSDDRDEEHTQETNTFYSHNQELNALRAEIPENLLRNRYEKHFMEEGIFYIYPTESYGEILFGKITRYLMEKGVFDNATTQISAQKKIKSLEGEKIMELNEEITKLKEENKKLKVKIEKINIHKWTNTCAAVVKCFKEQKEKYKTSKPPKGLETKEDGICENEESKPNGISKIKKADFVEKVKENLKEKNKGDLYLSTTLDQIWLLIDEKYKHEN